MVPNSQYTAGHPGGCLVPGADLTGGKIVKHKLRIVSVLMIAVLAMTSVSPALAGGKPFSTYLDWRQVVPYGTGDPNILGDASLTVNGGQGELCYQLKVYLYLFDTVSGVTIHQGAAGENGPQVVDLHPVFDGYNADGCVRISSTLAKDIQQHPAQYYVLVTDGDYPAGAARGQLHK
jgi:hypothetical protein